MVQARKIGAGLAEFCDLESDEPKRRLSRLRAAWSEMPWLQKLAGIAFLIAAVNMSVTLRQNARLVAVKPGVNMVETGSVTIPAETVTAAVSAPAAGGMPDPGSVHLHKRIQTILADAEAAGPKPQTGPPRKGGSDIHRAPNARMQGPDLPAWMDPSLEPYQRDADRKLKEEKEDEAPQQEPAAVTANPESYVVLCTAGCRPLSDRIVYKISKTAAPAAELAKARLVTTGAEASDGSGEFATAENTVVCIAGCYDDSEPKKPDTKRAQMKPGSEPKPAVRLAAVADHAKIEHAYRPRLKLRVRPVPLKDARPHAIAALTPGDLHSLAPAALVTAAEAEAAPPPAASPTRLADTHLLSTETRGHETLKRVKAVVSKAAPASKWRTIIVRFAGRDSDPQHKPSTSPTSAASIADAWEQRTSGIGTGIGAWETAVSREVVEQAWRVRVIPAAAGQDGWEKNSAPFGDVSASIAEFLTALNQ